MASYPGDPRIRRQAEALDEAGYEVDVLCRYSGKQPPIEKFGNVTAYRIMNAPSRENKIIYFLQSILFLIVAFFRLLPLSIKRNYKVIQAHNLPDYLIFAGVLHKIFGVKLILDIHDPSVDLFEEKWPGKKNRLLKYIIKNAEKFSCKISDHLITVTNTCKERLVARGNSPEKITLILNTANENIFTFNNEREVKVINEGVNILYHGTIAERFGLHNAIRATKLLLKDIPDSILNIYGRYDNSYREKLEKIIVELELANNVNLYDKVTREQIPELINNHDIGIVPYLKTDYMNLALPTKAFEYIAAGLPVISTRLKDLSETFDNNCITYVENDMPKDISEAIKFLCINPIERKRRLIAAKQKLSDISGSVMRKRFVTLYDEMTQPKSHYIVTSSESSS
ncbi:MAG: glycosyltransferase family 4 protein [Ignavibacteria bacterium]|nr:glycosyltransferase family 4 protein [Ignavibacteria bacterium]